MVKRMNEIQFIEATALKYKNLNGFTEDRDWYLRQPKKTDTGYKYCPYCGKKQD